MCISFKSVWLEFSRHILREIDPIGLGLSPDDLGRFGKWSFKVADRRTEMVGAHFERPEQDSAAIRANAVFWQAPPESDDRARPV